jgi:hypothetical protein
MPLYLYSRAATLLVIQHSPWRPPHHSHPGTIVDAPNTDSYPNAHLYPKENCILPPIHGTLSDYNRKRKNTIENSVQYIITRLN